MTRLLIIDDEKMLLDTLEYFFLEFGFEVVTESSSVQALQRFQEDTSIDAVLTDIRMPELSGSQLIQEVLATRMVPAIAITGYSDVEPHFLRDYGAVQVLSKPLEYEKVIDSIVQATTKRFPGGAPEVAQLRLMELDHLGVDQIAFGRHGFYVSVPTEGTLLGEQIKFQLPTAWADEPLIGTGRVTFQQAEDGGGLKRGLAIEVLSMQQGLAAFDQYLADKRVSASVPLLYLQKGR